MNPMTAGSLLCKARLGRGLSQEGLAIRAGVASVVIVEIEADRVSPTIEMLGALLGLLGEDLVLEVEERKSGIDLTLNRGNLELGPEHRVAKGLAFADVIRENRNAEELGRSVQLGPLLGALDHQGVDFVVIGSIAGLAHGSAYPTYDVDLAYAGNCENLQRMAMALSAIGLQIDSHRLGEKNHFSFDSPYGTLDILRQIPGVETYGQLRRDSTQEVLAGVRVRVASLNHLISMKRAANRTKDQLMVLEYVELAEELRRREDGDTGA